MTYTITTQHSGHMSQVVANTDDERNAAVFAALATIHATGAVARISAVSDTGVTIQSN